LTSYCCRTASTPRCCCRSSCAFSASHSRRSVATRCSYSCAACCMRAWSSRQAAGRAGAGAGAGAHELRVSAQFNVSVFVLRLAPIRFDKHPRQGCPLPTCVRPVQLHLVLRCQAHAQRLQLHLKPAHSPPAGQSGEPARLQAPVAVR
jgi:hypothetical protein